MEVWAVVRVGARQTACALSMQYGQPLISIKAVFDYLLGHVVYVVLWAEPPIMHTR